SPSSTPRAPRSRTWPRRRSCTRRRWRPGAATTSPSPTREAMAMKARGDVQAALRSVEQGFLEMKETLATLSRIPSVSAPGFPPAEVERSAQAFAALLRRIGLDHAQVLRV